MAKLTKTKKVLYFKIIHNLDIQLTNYPKRCPSGLHTVAVTESSLENKRDKRLSSIFLR